MVVGTGFVGRGCAAALASAGHAVEPLSARALMAGEAAGSPQPANLLVFAHGKPVTVKRFASAFDDLLASRTEPMRLAAALPGVQRGTRAVLISSTVACLPSPSGVRDLPALQREFEAIFLALFPEGSVLRLGAMRGPGWQIDLGLPPLRKTLLLKRLRMSGSTDIPWADDNLLAEALGHAAEASGPVRRVVAYPEGFDINALLDAGLGPMGIRLRIPDEWFRAVYQSMGAPPAFMLVSMRAIADSGW